MLKKVVLFIVLVISVSLHSQTLYWVGGSGSLNDSKHWSFTSGGPSCNKSPDSNSELIFDDNSSNNTFVINIVGLNYAKSLTCSIKNNDLHFTGDKSSNFTCSSNFILNDRTFFEATTRLIFSSTSKDAGSVNSWKNVLSGDVLFESGNWNLQTVKLSETSNLVFNQGTYNLQNCLLVTGNLEANSGKVVFNTTASQFLVKNKLTLGDNISFISNDFILIAQSNNPSLYNVSSNISFGNNYKSKVFKPLACVVSTGFTNASCFGSCDASFSVNFDAGCNAGPYDLLFTTSAPCIPSGTNSISPPTLTFSGLCDNCAGYIVDVIVFDGGGNFVTSASGNTHAIRTRAGINFSNIRQPSCFGLCNGSVNFIVSSGQQPYRVFVNPSTGPTYTNVIAFSTNTVTGLCVGVQTFSVVDNANCVTIGTVNVTQPSVLLANGASSSITCNGACNGTALSSPTGGTAPYTYSWSTTAITSSVSGLCSGTVSLVVTDSRSCTATYSTTIAQPPAITLTVNKANLKCGAVCDGTAAIVATGGTGAYSYVWSPGGQTSSSETNLCAGIYTVDVTDALNCIRSVTFEITAPPTLTATPTQTNVLCNASCNGIIRLNASGGNPSYSYSWNPSVSSASVATGLCAGVYSYTVTDNQLCTYTNTLAVTQPPATTLSISKTDVTCFGSCNGVAIANLTGGTAPYTYTWSPGSPTGQGTSTITGLCPNNYTVSTRDFNGCLTTSSVNITQPLNLITVTSTISPTCNGICDGSINAITTGGTAPYSYTLQPTAGAPIVSGLPFSGLCAGSYTLRVRDAQGCLRTQTITLSQPNPVLLSLTTTSISCFNQCNASISTVVNGGTPVYTYTWSNGSNAPSLINQCTGVYSSTVTDGNGCRASASVTVTSPTDMTVAITPTNPNCNGQCTGIASATVSGGTPNYTINWNTGATGNTASSLCQGTYTATVRDFLGCVKIQTVSIITPPVLTLASTNGSASCAGACNGTVSVVPSGGTPGYFVSWNTVPVQTATTATGLCAGNYVANVTDSRGCVASIGASVTQPTVLTTSISNVMPSCNVCIGSANATGIGGTAPYTYNWLPGGQTIANPNDLCVGTQTVITTDSRGCTSTSTVFVSQTVIVLLTSNGSTLTCNGACTGIATANASGGLAPYSYSWSPSPIQTSQTATGLCAGSHTVIVTDVNGCFTTDIINFVSPPAITLTVNKTDVTCNGSCNGVATASASGGTGTISYLWQPGGFTTNSISGLCPGNYTVTASDGNNCSQTQVVTITQSNSLTAVFTSNNPSGCTTSDGSISFVPSGGVAPYSFTWTPGGSINPIINLPDGSYVLRLRDANNCNVSFTTTLSDPLGPVVTSTTNSVTCFGQCTGSSSLSISGNGPFITNWPTIPSTNTLVTNLCAGTYVSSITDNNGCVTNHNVVVSQPSQIAATGIARNVTCNSVCSGSVDITTSGGIAPYSYTWTPSGGFIEDPINLCVGVYSVNITDVNNCTVINNFTITQPSSLTLTFNKKDVLCNGGCTGGARAMAAGGSPPYNFTWIAQGSFVGASLDTIVNLCTGTYSVIVTDLNGCSITSTVNIGEPSVLTSSVSVINAKCNGVCNGRATLNASGGTMPYSFFYNTTPVVVNQTVSNLCVGTYTGTVLDANGCLSTNGFSISQPAAIVVSPVASDPKCNAVCNGSISTTVTGGNPNYHYNWIPSGGPVQNPFGLCAGNYTVIVTDDSLCTGQALVTLTNPPALVSNISFTNPTCSGGCTGVLTANPSGGTLPYSYSWSNPINTNQTVTNLCAGIYTLNLTDANLCQNTQTIALVAPSLITINPAVTPASCGNNNGSINVVANNGNPPYIFNWLPPISVAQSTNTLVTGISSGVYTVVVTDASLCTATISVPVSNSNGPTGATITFTDVACNTQCNGAAEISNPLGGTAPYVIAWLSPVSTNSLITGLCAGNYTAQITDANNCLLFQSITINEPQVIDDNEAVSNAACFGNCNGAIALNPTGGNGGYSYVWNTGSLIQTIAGLCPGTYSVMITDSKNCSLNVTYNMPSLTTITSSTFATNNTCFGDCNGTLLATNLAGGIPPYTFNWNDPLGQSAPQAFGLCNGSYSVTITDANGCFDQIPANVTSPSQVVINPVITDPACGLCNGSAVINLSGGTPNYNVQWSNTQTGTALSNLCAGVYMANVTDGNGCVSTANIVVNSSSTITGELITKTDETCFGLCNGTVSVSAVGGVLPISYNWLHNGSSSQSLTGVCAGTYYCNMTDNNGCTRTASVVVGAAVTLSVNPQVTQSSCLVNTGSITVSVAGGAGGYTYTWLPSGSTPTVSGLAPGSYTLTVTDLNGCSETNIYSIGSVNGPVLSIIKKDISCAAVCDGNIVLTITGGNPSYTIGWSNGATTPTVSGLCAGNYSVEVTDIIGCKAVQNIQLTDLPPLMFNVPNINQPQCHDDCNGALTAIPLGGTLPYNYSWSPSGVFTPNVSNLCSGIYSVTVTDANGCSSVNSYTLVNPTIISLTSTVTNANCSNTLDGAIDITVVGGVPSYSYTWTNGSVTEDLTNVLPGTYSLTITDHSGCVKDSVFIINPSVVVVAVAGNDTSFCQNGTLVLDGSASVGGLTYQWLQAPLNTIISNTLVTTVSPAIGTNTYVLVATNGACVYRDTILVVSNPLPVVDAGPFVSIPTLTSIQIGGNPTSPTSSLLSWSPSSYLDNASATNPVASNTVTTTFTVTVSDANGCTNFDTVTVFVYPQIKIPTGFSPNADGKNDTWMIDLISLFPDCEVEVYNRWGEQLYYSKGYSVPWNGQYKGKDLPVGTYYYIINLNHPAYPNAYTSPLTIFR